MLPVRSLFSTVVLSYKTVFGHFRKLCKNGDWKNSWIALLDKYKSELDMSSIDIDGSHTTALRGGEQVAYQGRKKRKTNNSIYLTDRQGIPLAFSTLVSGNHHDVYQIDIALEEMFEIIKSANIATAGLFANADGGFDCRAFRNSCLQEGVFLNVAFNERNGERGDEDMLDELLYRERYSIERANAWMDSYRTVLNRFDRTLSSWSAWNYITFFVIFIKKIH